MVSDCHFLPVRQIRTLIDLESFHSSFAYERLLNFINLLSHSIIEVHTTSTTTSTSPFIEEIFETLLNGIALNPPKNISNRFGNIVFKDWIDLMSFELPRIHKKYSIPNWQEISSYLLNSLGDRHRIDYGTGHETHFIIWMLLLWESNSFPHMSMSSLIFSIFYPYIQFMRKIHKIYLLEPAGSHGVWGLDDFHFLPFLFGASQLRRHKYLKPKHIRNSTILHTYKNYFIYFDLVYQLILVKPDLSLRWHAPLLDDISAVKTWDKVADGLLKMYSIEVLSKLPIMQHLLFGSLFSFDSTGSGSGSNSNSNSNNNSNSNSGSGSDSIYSIHLHSNRGDCCGNPIPSRYSITVSEDSCQHSSIGGLPID